MSQDQSQHSITPRRRLLHGLRHRLHRLFGHRTSFWGAQLTLWEWAWLSLIYGSLIVVMCFLGATLRPYRLEAHRYAGPTLVYSSDGVLLAKLFDEYRVPVTIDQVPRDTVHAILAAEDERFFRHNGLDARGMARALWADMRAGRIVQGGSTITQQLVRNELLNPRRSFLRKVKEATLAVRIERSYTKQQILERYLNSVYFGDGAYGIGAAAQRYFGKPVHELTAAESALLAGLIRAPSDGNPRHNLPAAIRRQQGILRSMHQNGWLANDAYQHARHETLALKPYVGNSWRAPYVVETVRQDLVRRYGRDRVYRGGLVVSTTIDSRMQRAAERALRDAVRAGRGQRVGNGALVAIAPRTGYIRAMVGGTNFWDSQYNRAVQAHRQPGSAFKVFVYQAAIDAGYSLYEYELDAPVTIGRWSPRNYSNRYHGYVTLQDALANSLNSVAVRLARKLTPRRVIDAAHRAGIDSRLTPNLTIALGSSEVTPLEMARAFATYANGGQSVPPTLIRRIADHEKVLFQSVPVAHRQVNSATAYQLTLGLQHVITDGTGQRADIGRPAAGKTGTSSQYRDAWFVGFTPELSTAVWLGNDNRRPMAGVTGGSLPAKAWAQFMRAALRNVPVMDFSVPDDLVSLTICATTGKRALPTCQYTRQILVTRDHAPTTYCDVHIPITERVCSVSGDLPNDTCPTVERQFPQDAVPTQQCTIDHSRETPRATTPQQRRGLIPPTPAEPTPQPTEQPGARTPARSIPRASGGRLQPPSVATPPEEAPDLEEIPPEEEIPVSPLSKPMLYPH